ncbi:bifunctional 5,10-methylenetetrahydrofolate dehydrogenase/5,10-methenyltetrahydrofolate cyclohydrolase [Streptomyces sp. NPDC058682]|uniref:bifunctional 5,10-methylenetetrahydrofolate dehydrogenase/5,10-methenyltetrahydrofolate cyclohydrolase n=1 Tax=Streptomyces sp. NPDC058682 TaxID=3346596 RepID=UPI003664003F
MKLIDGRAAAAEIMAEVSAAAAELRSAGTDPTLAIVVPTRDEATAWYVRSIERAAAKAGVSSRVEQLDAPTADDISGLLRRLSADPSVHGIICQTPLPDGVRLDEVTGHIDPGKDVDGANPTSLGQLAAGLPTFAPATAAAVLELLHREKAELSGARTVVVGRSTVVGKPAALLLLNEHATVTVCHSRTAALPEVCADADILVVAVGRAHFVGAEHIKPGAVVIDVGTNPTADGGLTGDVDPAAAEGRAGSYTPVPGGVGPVTTALLLRHTVAAARGEASGS